MTFVKQIPNSRARLTICFMLFALLLLLCAPAVFGQQSPVNDSDTDVINNLDQTTLYPIQSQMAQTSNQNHLNDNANTTRYRDDATSHGPFFFSVESMGNWTNNLQRTYDNVPAMSGEYVQIGAPAGLHLKTARSDFKAFARVSTDLYPGYSNLNHTSEVYSHQLIHKLSDITTSSWSLAGGHVVTLGQYLSPIIGVGSTGVITPQETGGIQASNNAATTYTLSHQLSERDTISGSGTVGWIDQPVIKIPNLPAVGSYQQVTGGAVFKWQHALNTRELTGVSVTNVYVKGINPDGDTNFTSAELTFSQTLTPHTFFSAGIGPLFIRSVVPGIPNENTFSYAANASIEYSTFIGHLDAGYARMYAVGYLAPSSVANQLFFSFDRPITRRLHFTTDTSYIITSLPQQQATGNYSTLGFTTRLDMYFTRGFVYQVGASVFNQDSTQLIPGYRYDNVSGGLTYFFGRRPSVIGEEP